MRIIGCLVVLALSMLPLEADAASKITTKDGTVIIGDVELLQNNVYTIRTPYGAMRIPSASIDRIEPTAEFAPQPAQNGQQTPSSELTPQQSDATQPGPLRFAGSNTIGAELAPRLLEGYAKKQGFGEFEWRGVGEDRTLVARGKEGEFTADVSSHGSGTAPVQLLARKADIGMMSRPIKKDEVAKLAGIGFGQADQPGQEHVIALDGVVVIVNKDNPITRLSLKDIQGLFSGEIADWSQLGGKAGAVKVYSRDDKSGTYDTFKSLVLRDKKLTPSAKRYEDSKELSDDVSADEGGIGFIGFAYVRNARALAISTECGLTFEPKEFAVKTEEYPLARRLFLYTPKQVTHPRTNGFVEFALSSEAQPTAEREGFVSLLPEKSAREYVGQRMIQAAQNQDNSADAARKFTEFSRLIAPASRLSITYRFQTASDALDLRAVRDIDRLAEFLGKPENQGLKITLAGFADPRGTFQRNVLLSKRRADAIANALRQRGVTIAEVEGYGPVAPVACNTNDVGMEKNRRVEVWLK